MKKVLLSRSLDEAVPNLDLRYFRIQLFLFLRLFVLEKLKYTQQVD